MLTWPDPTLPPAIREALTGPGGPYELVEDLVLGAPMEVFTNRPRSMVEVLTIGAERFPDLPYVVFPDRQLTFSSIIEPVAAVAHHLSTRYGVGRGDRVGIVSADRVEYLLTFWAATSLGAITVALNGWWTGPEMLYGIELTKPKVLFGDSRRLARLDGADLGDLPVVEFESDFAPMEKSTPGTKLPDVAMHEDDPYVILFTSGTTGRPKGAVISHRSNIHFGLATQLRAAESIARNVAAGGEAPQPFVPCIISASPMFHVSGLTCTLALSPLSGMKNVFPPAGRWSEEVQLRLTQDHGATSWSLVPTQLWRLLDWPDLHSYDLSSLRSVGGGSAVWPPELLKRLEKELPWARPGLGLGYGMTETNGHGISLRSENTYTHPDSIGQAAPTVKVEVRDPLTRQPLPDGAVGEIALRTPAGFVGYWDNPEATTSSVDEDRWYHTGDFGHVSDGFVYLEGRRTDMIIRGGENVYPVEIENRLFEHPDIAEAAVVGVDHPTLGQEVKAYLVVRPGASLAPADVETWCRAALAGFKVPSQVEFVTEMPHNATGKVVKHLLGRAGDTGDFIQE